MPAEKVKLKDVAQSVDLFPFQLTSVRLYGVHAEHCQPDGEKQEDAVFGFSLAQGDEPPEAKEFGILLTFEGTIPSGENDACKLKLGVEGRFATTVDPASLKPDVIEKFRKLDSAVLLWPYLRQYVHDLTTRMGLGLAPLPTIDVRVLLTKTEKHTEEK